MLKHCVVYNCMNAASVFEFKMPQHYTEIDYIVRGKITQPYSLLNLYLQIKCIHHTSNSYKILTLTQYISLILTQYFNNICVFNYLPWIICVKLSTLSCCRTLKLDFFTIFSSFINSKTHSSDGCVIRLKYLLFL